MKNPILLLAAVFAIGLSSAIMLYIALATPMGPWIETTVALLLLIPLKIFYSSVQKQLLVATPIVAAAGVAGIIATATAFSLPAIGFIDPTFFPMLLEHWVFACCLIGGLIVSAGMVGLGVAVALRRELIEEKKLPFPVGSVVYEMIAATGIGKGVQLLAGGVSALIISAGASVSAIRRIVASLGVRVRIDTAPIFFAVGFIAGPSLIIPLLVGVVSRFALIEPLRLWYLPAMPAEELLFSFFTGIVLFGAAYSIATSLGGLMKNKGGLLSDSMAYWKQYSDIRILIAAAMVSCIYFVWLGLPIIPTVLVIAGTIIACQQLAVIAGRMGIAPLGRYATFIMVPALVGFKVSPLLATLISAYVEIAGGVAADVLFGLTLSDKAQVSRRRTLIYQIIGIIGAALFCSVLLLLLVRAFGLGSPELFALKAKNRAWLIMAYAFDVRLVAAGSLFAALLSYFSINPVLVLGGLAMPADASLLLALGGGATYLTHDPRDWYPFLSGVFAASSLWMVVRALISLIS